MNDPNALFMTCFSCPLLELDVGGNGCGELDQRMIEQRHARLHTVRHAHAIFDVQQRRQQGLEVEMRHEIEIRFLSNVVAVEDAAKRLERRIVAENLPVDLVAQRAARD